MTNNGSLTDTQAAATGIQVDYNSATAASITNSSGATVSANGVSNQQGTALSLDNQGSGSVTITNNGALIATGGTAEGMTITTGGTTTISNAGTITSDEVGISATDSAVAADIFTLNNTGTITAGEQGIYAYSANTASGATFTVNTSNNITVTGDFTGASSSGIYAKNFNGATQVNITAGTIAVTAPSGETATAVQAYNTGTGDTTIDITGGSVTATGQSGAYAVYEYSSVGNAIITNSRTITATTAAGTASGLYGYSNESLDGVTITNSGSISATANTGAFLTTGIVAYTSNSATITNSGTGTISALNSGGGDAYGIYAEGPGSLSVTNTSTGLVSGTASGSNRTGSAIYIYSSSGSAYIKNTGPASSTGPAAGDAITLEAYATTTGTINNSGILSATTPTGGNSGGYASDLFINGATGASMTIINSGNGTSTGSYAYGITAYGSTGSPVTVTNSGNLTATATYTASALYANTKQANIMISNSATVSGTGGGTSSGIYASATTSGDITITNTKTGSAIGSTTYAKSGIGGFGIYANTLGNVTINNAGYASGTETGGGTGAGIYVTAGTATINNTGTASGSDYGIVSYGVTTINDGGTVSGNTNSIYVHSGSTVNLTGSSPLSGLMKGGSDDTSTSLLNFNLTVRSGYAQAKAALDSAIINYEIELGAATKGHGDDVTSEVVTINGSQYQWQDFLTIEDNLIQGRLYAQTPNFFSEGTVLDNLDINNPQAAKILNALGNLPDSALPAALSELSPKELELFRNVAFDNNTFNDQQIDNHLANLRDGLTGFDSSALTIHDSSMDSALAPIASHLLAYNPANTPGLLSDSGDLVLGGVDMKDTKETKAACNCMPTERWSSFIAGDVILADLNGNPNLDDSNYTTGSVTGGVDYRIDEHFTLGALFAYAHTDADLDQRGSSGTVDSYSPGIYASYVDGPWYANALGAYTRNAYTSDRQINISGLYGDNHGATSGNQGSVNLTGGYEFHKGSFKFGPVASVDYVHLSIDSIQEQGPTALSIGSQDADSFRSRLGLEARYEATISTPLGPVLLNPHVSASWQREYLDNSDGITSQFTGTGGGSFTTQTDSPDRNSAFVDGGLDATLCKNITLFVDYEAQAGQDNFFAQSAQGGVKIGF